MVTVFDGAIFIDLIAKQTALYNSSVRSCLLSIITDLKIAPPNVELNILRQLIGMSCCMSLYCMSSILVFLQHLFVLLWSHEYLFFSSFHMRTDLLMLTKLAKMAAQWQP